MEERETFLVAITKDGIPFPKLEADHLYLSDKGIAVIKLKGNTVGLVSGDFCVTKIKK